MRATLVLLFAATGCRQLLGLDSPSLAGDAEPVVVDMPVDMPIDTPIGSWSVPVVALPDGGTKDDDDPTATGDRLELFFNRNNDIFRSVRASVQDPWGVPEVVLELSSVSVETTPEISSDGLTIFFSSDRGGGMGSTDLMTSIRPNRQAAWSSPTFVIELNTIDADSAGGPKGDLLEMAFTRGVGSAADLFFTSRASTSASWGVPMAFTQLNTAQSDRDPSMSEDALTMVFASDRTGVAQLYIATRVAVGIPFDPAVVISELATGSEEDPWISPNVRHLVFTQSVGGVRTIVESSR